MNLELKYLSGYLPYGLKIQNGWGDFKTLIYTHLDDEGNGFITQVRPILRPLSDLTKEIEVNGEKFVPSGQMITHGFHNSFWYELDEFDYRFLYTMDFNKLLEWHFDIYKLIENGLAISIHDIE